MFPFKRKSGKKIFFVVPQRRWGTYYLRGVQIQKGLRRNGVDASVVRGKHIARCRDGIVVFVKNIAIDECSIALGNGNRIVWDILDGYADGIVAGVAASVELDGLITSTAASATALADLAVREKTLIYHHIDPRILAKTHGSRKTAGFSIGYIGNIPEKMGSLPFRETFACVNQVGVDTRHAERCGWMRGIAPYRCHFAVRLDPVECRMKPLAKVGVAAGCNANIIVNRSNAAVELLGTDYPFLCEDSVEAALSMIATARKQFGSAVWQQGLARMDALKGLLSLENSIDAYQRFLARFY